MSVSNFPFEPVDVRWKRPTIEKSVLKRYTRRSNFRGLLVCLGVLALLGASGAASYWFFLQGQWLFMGLALYIHGGFVAFNPQTHELAHGTVFKARWLNEVFKRIFGLIHWNSNSALYWMSHKYHHRYTLHRKSEGEEVHPRPETTEQVLQQAIKVVDVTKFVNTVYDQVSFLIRPYLRNPRRNVWQRYVYAQATDRERRDAFWTGLSQLGFHIAFAAAAVASGYWFLVVVVTLPMFYGGSWYHTLVHDTMHVGRTPETDDFRDCCRSVKVDPLTSLLYWHMEWHTEHHTFPAIPCYNLRAFHKATAEHWEPPQTLAQAWREMNERSYPLLAIPEG